jgi:hypothetical protein
MRFSIFFFGSPRDDSCDGAYRLLLRQPGEDACAEAWTVVAKAWHEVFGEAPAGRDAHFFDCGGNSLQALTCSALIGERLGTELPPTIVFEHPVAGKLAVEVARRGREAGRVFCLAASVTEEHG